MNLNELEKILMESEKPSEYFEKIRSTGILPPELKDLIGVPQNQQYHKEGDVWTHTMLVLDEAAKRRSTAKNPLGFMMSALCHDFGKVVCTEKINGVIHAYSHETEGLPVISGFLEELGVDAALKTYILNMSELHMLPNIMANAHSKTKSTNKLFDNSVEPYDLVQLAVCDGLGKIPQNNSTEKFLLMRLERYREIMARPHVTEYDLQNMGISERLDKVMIYAHKLRLAGVGKESSLKQCVSYARKVLKI